MGLEKEGARLVEGKRGRHVLKRMDISTEIFLLAMLVYFKVLGRLFSFTAEGEVSQFRVDAGKKRMV